jgi:PAS domain S-box-containing protein
MNFILLVSLEDILHAFQHTIDIKFYFDIFLRIRVLKKQRTLQQKSKNSEEALNATLNALPDLLFEVDSEGRIYDYRAPNPQLLYCVPEEFLGKTINQILPKNESTAVMSSIKEASMTGKSSGMVYSLNIGGTINWFELSVAVKGKLNSPKTRFICLVRDITARKQYENMLKEAMENLSKERKALTERNIALGQILEHIEEERQVFRQKICKDIKSVLVPLLEKLKKSAGPNYSKELHEIEYCLSIILTKDIGDFNRRYSELSSRESEICEMIKSGMSSKEISDTLNLSLLTVHKHREQIRKKLEITNKNIDLATFLRLH